MKQNGIKLNLYFLDVVRSASCLFFCLFRACCCFWLLDWLNQLAIKYLMTASQTYCAWERIFVLKLKFNLLLQ